MTHTCRYDPLHSHPRHLLCLTSHLAPPIPPQVAFADMAPLQVQALRAALAQPRITHRVLGIIDANRITASPAARHLLTRPTTAITTIPPTCNTLLDALPLLPDNLLLPSPADTITASIVGIFAPAPTNPILKQ